MSLHIWLSTQREEDPFSAGTEDETEEEETFSLHGEEVFLNISHLVPHQDPRSHQTQMSDQYAKYVERRVTLQLSAGIVSTTAINQMSYTEL